MISPLEKPICATRDTVFDVQSVQMPVKRLLAFAYCKILAKMNLSSLFSHLQICERTPYLHDPLRSKKGKKNYKLSILFLISHFVCFCYSLSRKTVNTRKNFWNVYCFAKNQMRDETAKDNRQPSNRNGVKDLISHDFTRSNVLAFFFHGKSSILLQFNTCDISLWVPIFTHTFSM